MLNTFTYDDDGHITSKFDGNRSLSWDEKQFIDYDDDGRIISERNEGYYGDSTENPSNTTQKSYTYDWLGRVATETVDGVTTTFAYDAVGNLLSKTTGDLTTTYKINELDQVTEVKTNDNVIQATYTYDLSGNRISKYSYGYTTTYTYDGQNNLTSIAGDQQTTSTYTYDANGERLTKLNQTHTTQYYYDGVNLLFTKRNNSIDVRYLYDEGAVYCAVYNDIPYWYNTDIRGSVTNILKGDETTSITTTLNKSYVYDAYGNTDVTATTEFRNSIAYTGAIFDQETGLYYLMSRYYDPEIAQFISEDSYRGDGEHFWNLYMYCEGDPVNNVDREGHYKTELDAVKAFYKAYYRKCRYIRFEFGAKIYKEKKEYKYKAMLGEPHSVDVASIPLKKGQKLISYTHTQPNSNSFSDADKRFAFNEAKSLYLMGPDQKIKKMTSRGQYSCVTGYIPLSPLSKAVKDLLVRLCKREWIEHYKDCTFQCRKKLDTGKISWPQN